MDIYRTFLAIIVSFLILIGYQYFFVGFGPVEVAEENGGVQTESVSGAAESEKKAVVTAAVTQPSRAVAEGMNRPDREARTVTVDTDVYTALFSEDGGAVKSFVLKDYRETGDKDSPGMQLVKVDGDQDGLPLEFSWGSVVPVNTFYETDATEVAFAENTGSLVMRGQGNGLEIERAYVFNRDSYVMELAVRVKNISSGVLQGTAELHQSNKPFRESGPGSQFLFVGPAYYMNESLSEVKVGDYEDGPKTVDGRMDWTAYEGTYFMCGIIPQGDSVVSTTMQKFGEEGVRMKVSSTLDTLQPGEEKVYTYKLYFGPKKLDILKSVGSNLYKAVNFGWFDVIAQPTLWLLNIFYGVFKNYGIAIIMVTIIFKAIFWPITQKGLKSMKNMQKLQPKMVKLKEKYKNDPTRMNQEVMNLYKTYKVNPLGGVCPWFCRYLSFLPCIRFY